jgi:bacteriocin biosynthesis cyclodehydratase domain-containing protein
LQLLLLLQGQRAGGLALNQRAPIRPLLAPWYRLVEDGNRLLLEHGRSVVVLEGAAVRTFVPSLLPLLDGTRTADELEARLGAPARPAIDLVLELLAANRLLVEGPDATAGPAAARAIAAAYELAPTTAATRLRTAQIGIVGSAAAGAEVARLLHAAGVGTVGQLDWDGGGVVDLAVVAPAPTEVGALGEWNELALGAGVRWLALRPHDGRVSTVGPLIVPGESCCYECLLRRLAGHVEYGRDLATIESVPITAGTDAGLESVAAGVAAHLALCWLGGRDSTLPGVLYAIESRPALSIRAHFVLRVPRCSACSTAERDAPRLPWHEAEVPSR